MDLPKLEIKTEGATTRIYKDGEELKGVRKAVLTFEIGCVVTAELEMMTTDLTANIDKVVIKEKK